MATYLPIPPDFESKNDAQKNEIAISLGYTGLNDLRDNANKQKQGGGGVNYSGGGTGGGSGIGGIGTIGAGGAGVPDLASIYKNLYDTSGITDVQKQLDALTGEMTAKQKAAADAAAKINDNPFYAEGTRVGRIAKLNELSNADQTVLTNKQKVIADQIATKKADIETALNIQTKQFDINSQAAAQALNQFNTLLSSGALDNASGSDIAALTSATGMSSSMIQSAINAAKAKNIQTSTISFDDGTNQGFAIINSQTGEIIKKQNVAASKPPAATATDTKAVYQNALREDAAKGATLSQIFSIYQGYLDPDTIYQLYNANSKWGPDNNPAALAGYGVKQPSASALAY